MKIRHFFVTIACLVLAASSVGADPAAPLPPVGLKVAGGTNTGPRLVFPTNKFDFGQIKSGQAVTHTFTFSNGGDQTLEITKVQPGCHCTTIGDWTKSHSIEPGQSGEIPLSFDSSGVHGNFTRSISVESNDKQSPRQMLQISGTVWVPLEVEPAFAFLTVMPDDFAAATKTIHIINHTDKPVTLSKPVCNNGLFNGTLNETRPGMEFELVVVPAKEPPPGSSTGTFHIKTSMPSTPELNISVTAQVQASLMVQPMRFILPPASPVTLTNRVKVLSNRKLPLQLTDAVVSNAPDASVSVTPAPDGKSFEVTLVVPPQFNLPPGQTAGVRLKSNYPEMAEVNIPIQQFSRRGPMESPGLRAPTRPLIPPPPVVSAPHGTPAAPPTVPSGQP